MAVDSHAHINSLLIEDAQKEICDINNNGNIDFLINIGLNYETSKESIEIAQKNPKFYSSVGIHPLYIKSQNIDDLYSLASNNKVVAIGEIGLDNLKNNFEQQKKYLVEQITIANELGLPVIIHSNNMNKEVIKIFEKYVKPKYGCVFHCFQPDLEDLKYLVKNEYYISFAGRVTYKNAKKSLEIARLVPNNLFLLETDSPYIAPEPVRNLKNHSANIIYIIKRLSDVKKLSYEEIETLTTENTKRLFKKI